MKELKWNGFYMITASAMKGLRFLMFHEPYLFLVWEFTTNMADCFPSSEIIVFGCYRTWISITFFRLCIGFNCNFYLVPNFCIWPTCFSIDMMPSTEDDFIKRVEFCFTEDVIFLLHVYENKLISCDLCWQSFIQYSVSRSIAIILLSIYVPFFAFSILWRFFFDKKEKSISRFAHQFCKISNGRHREIFALNCRFFKGRIFREQKMSRAKKTQNFWQKLLRLAYFARNFEKKTFCEMKIRCFLAWKNFRKGLKSKKKMYLLNHISALYRNRKKV